MVVDLFSIFSSMSTMDTDMGYMYPTHTAKSMALQILFK